MLNLSVKTNIKSILRDPTTVLSLVAAIILCYMGGFQFYTDSTGAFIDSELYQSDDALQKILQTVVGLTEVPIRTMGFPFIGIVIAINLFKDKKMGMYDLVLTGQITFFKYYLSKIVSYYLILVILCSSMTLIYEFIYCIVQIPANVNFDWNKVIIVQIVAMIVTYTGCLFIPIAWAVFWTALTESLLTGIVFNCIYRYLPNVIEGFNYSFWDHYVHVYPNVLYSYLGRWMLYSPSEWLTFKRCDPYAPESFYSYTSFKDAIVAHLIQIVISFVLLTISYFLLKRRLRQSD